MSPVAKSKSFWLLPEYKLAPVYWLDEPYQFSLRRSLFTMPLSLPLLNSEFSAPGSRHQYSKLNLMLLPLKLFEVPFAGWFLASRWFCSLGNKSEKYSIARKLAQAIVVTPATWALHTVRIITAPLQAAKQLRNLLADNVSSFDEMLADKQPEEDAFNIRDYGKSEQEKQQMRTDDQRKLKEWHAVIRKPIKRKWFTKIKDRVFHPKRYQIDNVENVVAIIKSCPDDKQVVKYYLHKYGNKLDGDQREKLIEASDVVRQEYAQRNQVEVEEEEEVFVASLPLVVTVASPAPEVTTSISSVPPAPMADADVTMMGIVGAAENGDKELRAYLIKYGERLTNEQLATVFFQNKTECLASFVEPLLCARTPVTGNLYSLFGQQLPMLGELIRGEIRAMKASQQDNKSTTTTQGRLLALLEQNKVTLSEIKQVDDGELRERQDSNTTSMESGGSPKRENPLADHDGEVSAVLDKVPFGANADVLVPKQVASIIESAYVPC